MKRSRSLAPIALALLLLASPLPALAQGYRAGPQALEGAWAMSITLRDCATGAALGPPFRSLLTFHDGGTVSESPGTTQFAPGQRSSGHGVWYHAGGSTFVARIVGMILFDTPAAPPAPGFRTGWQLIVSSLTITGPDRLDLSALVQFYDINRQLYRSACPTGTAERFR